MRNRASQAHKEKYNMSEIEKPGVEQEIAAPSDEEVVVELQEEEEEPKKGSAEYNFRELRKITEEQKKALDQQQQRIRELEYGNQREAPKKEDDPLSRLTDDDWLTVGQAKKLALREVEDLLAKRERDTLEDRVRLKFKDYDDVVSDENVAKLIEDDNDLADALRNSPNPYTTAYKLIRKSNFYKENEEGKKYKAETNNIQKNNSKPVSSNAVSAKPLAKANSYAQADLTDLYKEMQEYARRR